MKVNAINNVSLLNFEGRSKKEKKNKSQTYPQMNSPMSQKAANNLRNLLMAAMMLGAATATTSCTDSESWSVSGAEAWAKAWSNCNGCGVVRDTTVIHDTINNVIHDTVFNTVIEPIYIKEFPQAICDSLISQGVNIGIPLEGPDPSEGNVVFLASKAYNEYDYKFYETKVDSVETNKNALSLVTKVVDMYDPENPKTSWVKSRITDVPGKGIKIDRSVPIQDTGDNQPEAWNWKSSYSEIRSNGSRGNQPGKNIIYDADGNMIWKGQYEKGQEAGTFLYGTLALVDGEPYIGEDGQPEMTHYDFSQAKMWSDKVTLVDIPTTAWK